MNGDTSKSCTVCAVVKALAEFPVQSRLKDGRRSTCNKCFNAYRKEYRKKPHVKAAMALENASRIITIEQKEKYKAARKTEKNRAAKRARNKTDEVKASRREYLARPEVRERVLAKRRARYAAAEKGVAFRLDARLRSLIRRSIKSGKNNRSWVTLVDFNIEQFRDHMERQFVKGMSWDRFLAGDIEIDHIVAIKDFDIQSPDCAEFKACWSLANLRPMWAIENNHKRAKRLFLL